MMQIEKQREEYYKQLGTPPGVPTMKGATADPNNTGIGYNSIITNLGDHSVPEGWIQHPKFNGKGDVPGPPIQWSEPESPDNAQPGYGYVPTDTTNTEEIFFYHSDHLGSTSYITDAKTNITQFDAYLPRRVAGFSPKVRGFLNRWYNKGIEYLNNPQRAVSTANTVSQKSKNNDTE